jgi:type III pantothenate kinase
MLLAVDIGNSAIKFGLFEGEVLTSKFSIPTKRNAAIDEISLAVDDRLSNSIDAAIVCSVVPEIDPPMRDFLRGLVETNPVFLDNSFDFGLKINYKPLDALGTDRLVNASAAVEKYGAPCIVCSLGTATTIDVVSADREFLGGIIAPGLDALTDALHSKAPRLPKVEVSRPKSVIGNSTSGSIQSGIYYGYVSLIEGLLVRLRSESGVTRIVGTGGNAENLSAEFAGIMSVDPDLTLRGLLRFQSK